MPHELTLPFPVILMHTASGEQVAFPMNDTNAFQLGKEPPQLAEQYAARFQENVMDKGNYLALLDELRSGHFEQAKFSVAFPKSADGYSYPAFSLEFDYLYQSVGGAVIGILPALGLEAMAPTADELVRQLQEVVKAEFTSKKRLQTVHHIFAANWFEGVRLEQATLSVKAWMPSELEDLKKNKEKKLLPNIAEKLDVPQPTAFGREAELALLERILKGRFSRNVLVVGAESAGKSALVREFAHQKKAFGIEANIWETSAASLIKGLTGDTGWQDKLTLLVKELTATGDFLFVKNLAELFEVGMYEGNSVSMAEYLRPFLGRGELTLIAECTPEELARIELKSPKYSAFFQTVHLKELVADRLESVIAEKMKVLATGQRVAVEDEAIQEIIRLQRRFSPYAGMPGKPVRFLENILLELATNDGKKKQKQAAAKSAALPELPPINRELVIRHFCEESGLPAFMVDPALPMDTAAILDLFKSNVFGQEPAASAVVGMLAAVKAALTRPGKPIASFLFAGPTGVGKTELAKVLANFMFGSRERMVRFDMSEFSDPWSVMRLIGQSHFSEGLLTAAVRREPFCVLLFDEIEKADSKFYELLLQILSEGRLSDSRGKLVNFCSTIIIMTTNIGAANLQANRISWKKDLVEKDVSAHFRSAVEKHFRPELFNRIDSVVAFSPLTKAAVRHVVEREVALLQQREGIRFRQVDFQFDPAVYDFLAEAGYDPKYGARYLQRVMREKLVVPLAKELNQFEYDERLTVAAKLDNGQIAIQVGADPLGFDLLLEQWDKMTLADKASVLRRKAMLMLEGPLYMKFQSELDVLEEGVTDGGKDIWQNSSESKRYQQFKQAKEAADKAYQAVQDLELEVALAAIGQGIYQTDFEERLEAWEQRFFALQMEIHSLQFPMCDTCFLTIFGTSLEKPLAFYEKLLEAKDYKVRQARSIWFRENYVPPASPSEPADKGPYLRAIVPLEDFVKKRFVPPHRFDKLFGLELEVQGPGAWVYLNGEQGFQHWENDARDDMDIFYLTALLEPTPVTNEVHRHSFYKKGRARRVFAKGLAADPKLGLQLEMQPLAAVPIFKERLDALFEEAIVGVFFSADPSY